MVETPEWVEDRLRQAERIRLFLDYDGTLAEFAPTPDIVNPEPQVADTLSRLARHPQFRVAVISGRRLNQIRKLVPTPGVLLAGTYGIELMTPRGEHIDRLPLASIRPAIEKLKLEWAQLITDREGFFLEDKNWSLALHARYAQETAVDEVLKALRKLPLKSLAGSENGEPIPVDLWRVLEGDRFHEIGPALAHKGKTVEYLLEHYPWPGALLLYLGDDQRDEEAFEVVKSHGGIAVLVSPRSRPTLADFRLESPEHALRWLAELPLRIKKTQHRDAKEGELMPEQSKIMELKQELEKERQEVQSLIDNLPEAKITDDLDNADQGALSISYQTLEQRSNVSSQLKQRLWRIEAALQRIEEDRYGQCVDCGREIPIERLVQRPSEPRCVGCAELAQGNPEV